MISLTILSLPTGKMCLTRFALACFFSGYIIGTTRHRHDYLGCNPPPSYGCHVVNVMFVKAEIHRHKPRYGWLWQA